MSNKNQYIAGINDNKLLTFKPKEMPFKHETTQQIKKLVFEDIGAYTVVPAEKATPGRYPNRVLAHHKTNWEMVDQFDKILNTLEYTSMTDRGSFTKRLKKVLYKEGKVKASNDLLEKVGTLIFTYESPSKEFLFDITTEFDWSSGDFGDGGSCFFGGRAGIRLDMEKDGSYAAIRYFSRDFQNAGKGAGKYYQGYRGVGRAWFKKVELTHPNKKAEADGYIVFNSYGRTTNWSGKFLAEFLDLDVKAIHVVNKERTGGGLFINSGRGYLIGPKDFITPIKNWDFKLKEHYCKLAGHRN